MCLIINENQQVQVAKVNILCYKALEKGNYSDNQLYLYTKGIQDDTIILNPKDSDYYGQMEINQGYHSRVANKNLKQYWKFYATHLFMIPKGTYYYIGGENCDPDQDFDKHNLQGYVSSNIYFIGKNNWFNRLKARLIHKCKNKDL